MNNIVSLLFGKPLDRRRLISSSESLSSESEIVQIDDVDGDESVLDSLEQSNLDVGYVYFPNTRGERLLPSRRLESDDSTNLFSTALVSKPFNLHGLSALLPEKSIPFSGFEVPSVVVGEEFARQEEYDDFSNCTRSWNVLLRSHRSSRMLTRRGKIWRPVVVKLEGASLGFHTDESFPPFQVVSLLWSHEFRTPKYQDVPGEHGLFTTTLFNTLCISMPKRMFTKCLGGKTKVAKFGCTDRKVLHDLIGTVQRCIFGFPGFRQRGIEYRQDRMSVDIQEVYEGIPNDDEIKAITNVHVKVKALVSGSPKCCITLNNPSNIDSQQVAHEISFHKCVEERYLLSPIAVTFVPLDNCWFELIHFKFDNHKPAPLRCEISLIVSNHIELSAQIFATTSRSTRAVSHASNVTLQFHVPLSTAKKAELSGKGAKNTSVSKGKVHFTNETLLWSIHKLPLKTHKKHCPAGSEKPLASLNSHFDPATILNPSDFTKQPVHMDFTMRGNNVVNVEEITLGSKKFENLKTNYSSLFHVSIPVHAFRI